jgi:hypothetical protein
MRTSKLRPKSSSEMWKIKDTKTKCLFPQNQREPPQINQAQLPEEQPETKDRLEPARKPISSRVQQNKKIDL